MTDPDEHLATLRHVGQMADVEIDIAETALILSAMDRAGTPLGRYRAHLAELGTALHDVAAAAASAEAAAELLRHVMVEQFHYAGDRQTYDDMQNADLIRVIDRRRGLPVALGILYLHAARGVGWTITGIRFPAHFLLRLEHAGGRVIIDPFNEGASVDAPALRKLIKHAVGEAAELAPQYLEAAGNREVLLRLQNNIRTRATRSGELQRADDILQRMLLLAPEHADLHRDLAITEARKGNLRGAIDACERYAGLANDERQQNDAARLLQKLKVKLN